MHNTNTSSDISNLDTPVLRLPTKRLLSLLEGHGIYDTWKGLLSAHIRISHPHLSDTILSHQEFTDAPVFDDDMLAGLTIGQQSVLYEFSLAHADGDSRKDQGQYFTPDDVALFMANHALELDGGDGVWLDPCSGVGNLSWWLASLQEDPEDFVRNRLILQDKDPLALFIARVLFAVSFQKSDGDLFAETEGRFIVRDFLAEESAKHDYVIMNPPYAQTPRDPQWITEKAGDTYAYFMEKAIRFAKGFVSITPQSFTNSGKFTAMRSLLRDGENGFDIYCFDNMPRAIFRGVKFGSKNTNKVNSTRAAIVVRGTAKKERRITPMMRWKSGERGRLLAEAQRFLSPLPEGELFSKISAGTQELHVEAMKARRLESMLSKTPTPYSLTLASTPRYYISAVKRDLTRSSSRMLYFNSQDDLDLLYPYLNSSALYWWWRINDDGMTLGFETIKTLPLIGNWDFNPGGSLVSDLERSETENLMVKMNAGKPNENVKHPETLLQRLNEHYFHGFVDALGEMHWNSVFGGTAE